MNSHQWLWYWYGYCYGHHDCYFRCLVDDWMALGMLAGIVLAAILALAVRLWWRHERKWRP